MAEKPTKPSGDFVLKEFEYDIDGIYKLITDDEFKQGRNNTGEVETPLGSMTDAQKDNYLFRYLTTHINYLSKMVEYLDERIEGGT